MGEAIAVAANVIAILHLSEAVLTTCYQYISSVRNAPKEIERLAGEIAGLKTVLTDLRVLQNQAGNGDGLAGLSKATSAVNGPVKMCEAIIIEAREIIGSPAKLESKRGAIVWPWKEKSLNRLIDQLQHQKSTILLALNADQGFVLTELQKSVNELHRTLKQDQAIKWMSSCRPATNFHAARDKHEPLTGLWFLESDEFNDLVSKAVPSFIWLQGIPGCGKSVLAASIIEYMKARWCNDASSLFAYFFFDFSDSAKQTAERMLRSLLAQVARQDIRLLAEVEKYFDLCDRGASEPGRADLLRIWSCIHEYGRRIDVVIDALDECSDREKLISLVHEMRENVGDQVSFIVTSRTEKDFELAVEYFSAKKIQLTVEKVNPDVRLHILSCLRSDPRFQRWPKDLREEVESTLCRESQGMFRWVECQLEALRKCLKPSAVLQTLKELPKDLNECYERILSSIPVQYQREAFAAFRWLAYSYRPILLSELADAVVIGPDEFYPLERLFDITDLLEICSSLVVLEDVPHRYLHTWVDWPDTEKLDFSKDKIIKFAHASVSDFLCSRTVIENQGCFSMSPLDAHLQIAKSCLVYLTSSCFKVDEQACAAINFSKAAVDFPLLLYAAAHWQGHVQEKNVERNLHAQLVRLFQCSRKDGPSASITNMTLSHRTWYPAWKDCIAWSVWTNCDGQDCPHKPQQHQNLVTDRLALATLLDLNSVLPDLISDGADPNGKRSTTLLTYDTYSTTALELAIMFQKYNTIKMMLDLDADLNQPSVAEDDCPWEEAISQTDPHMLEFLVQHGARIDSRPRKILQKAITYDNAKMVSIWFGQATDADADANVHLAMVHALTMNKSNAFAALIATGAATRMPESSCDGIYRLIDAHDPCNDPSNIDATDSSCQYCKKIRPMAEQIRPKVVGSPSEWQLLTAIRQKRLQEEKSRQI